MKTSFTILNLIQEYLCGIKTNFFRTFETEKLISLIFNEKADH